MGIIDLWMKATDQAAVTTIKFPLNLSSKHALAIPGKTR
jgi:hypothetical protein